MPRKIMSPSEKRRVPVANSSSGSPSRGARSSNPSSSSPLSSSGNARGGGGGGAATLGLAPPPRAALSGTSSPSPDDRRNRDATAAAAALASGTNADAASTVAVAAAAAATQVFREKDGRIAELERELAIMEQEFTRELDKLSRAESERSTFWQAKYAALSEAAGATEAELRRMQAEARDGGGEGELRAGWEAALRSRDEEIRDLRRQIHGLKEWVSTSTRSDVRAQIADEELGYMMKRLGNELQNWVLLNLRRVKIGELLGWPAGLRVTVGSLGERVADWVVADLSKADHLTTAELRRLVPMYEELALSSKVHLMQSLIARLLVEMVFDAYFIGLSSDQARQLTEVETFLASFGIAPFLPPLPLEISPEKQQIAD